MNKVVKGALVAGAAYALQKVIRDRIEVDLRRQGVDPVAASFIAGFIAALV